MKKIAVITGASSGMGKRFAETVDRYGTFDEVCDVNTALNEVFAEL